MENSMNGKRLKCADVKKWDLVEYLAKLGYHHVPKKSSANIYLYHSPLNPPDESPSFKVDRRKNTWYDHSLGKGGDLIKFATLHDECTISQFLERLGENYFDRSSVSPHTYDPNIPNLSIEILRVGPITSFALFKYLKERRIDMDVAHTYCHEVNYRIGDKNYYGLGFKNNSGGWDLRNAWMKSASFPKDITTIDNGSKTVHAFEGFFDFLSFATIYKNGPLMKDNFCILNGLGMFERARIFMEDADLKNLYFDYGKGAQKCIDKALALKLNYVDMRSLYVGYKDLNHWHANIGIASRPKKIILRA